MKSLTNFENQDYNDRLISLNEKEYIYIKNKNSGSIDIISGPIDYFLKENEQHINDKIYKLIGIPPMHYVKIENPVLVNENREPIKDKNGRVQLALGQFEYRFHKDYKTPFYLHYGEVQAGPIQKLISLDKDQALRLKANKKFSEKVNKKNIVKEAGEEWLFFGPGIFYPKPEIELIEIREAIKIHPDKALRLQATHDFIDRNGIRRRAGDEWYVKTETSYLLDLKEKNLGFVPKTNLKDSKNKDHLRNSYESSNADHKNNKSISKSK